MMRFPGSRTVTKLTKKPKVQPFKKPPAVPRLPGTQALTKTTASSSTKGATAHSEDAIAGQVIKTKNPGTYTQGVVTKGTSVRTSNVTSTRTPTKRTASTVKKKKPAGTGGSGAGGSGGGGGTGAGGTTPGKGGAVDTITEEIPDLFEEEKSKLDTELADLLKEYDDQIRFLEQERDQQRMLLEQDRTLDDAERALALQELETQLNFNRQQIELQKQQIQSDMDEEQRQLPLRLRDIADEWASRGAFQHGRRGEAQGEATTLSGLAMQGMQRQMRGQELSEQEADAMAAIRRGEIGIAAQRDLMQTEADLWATNHGFEVDTHNLTYRYKQAKKELTEAADRDLSPTELYTGYELGIINIHELKKGLRDLGYSEAEARYLARVEQKAWELQSQPEGKNISPDQLETMFRQGLVSKSDYVSALVSMGYPKAQAEALAASAAKKGPISGPDVVSRESLVHAYKIGLLTKPDLITSLMNLGMSKGIAEFYATVAEAEKAQADAKDASGKSLTKTDLTKLYHMGKMSRKAYIENLIALGWNKDQANALADANVPTSPMTGGGSDPSKWPFTTVLGSVIGPRVGAQMGDPTGFIDEHYNSYIMWKNNVTEFYQKTGSKEPSRFITWMRQNIMNQKDPTDSGDKKKVEETDKTYTESEANAYLKQYAKGISLVFYRLFYGGAKAYPYKPPPGGAGGGGSVGPIGPQGPR